ncbi:MAG: CBS domain-containing protein [Desulfobacterales bacterium]
MENTAGAVMNTRFVTLSPDNTIVDAVRMLQSASKQYGRRVFGMMVTDENNRLVGMLSMYDIFLFLRPKHIEIWGEMDDIDLTGVIEDALSRAKTIRTGDIMTTNLITITPDTSLMMIVDIMIKKHVRRLPVVDGKDIVGIVFISDIFDYLLAKFTQ